MGLGSTARKLQELADAAEKLFRQLSDLRDRVQELEDALQSTADDVSAIDREQRRQRALLEAVAEEQGVDVDAVLADVEAELEAESAEAADEDGAESSEGDAAESAEDAAADDAKAADS